VYDTELARSIGSTEYFEEYA
jgi:propionyl-CoA synthetase